VFGDIVSLLMVCNPQTGSFSTLNARDSDGTACAGGEFAQQSSFISARYGVPLVVVKELRFAQGYPPQCAKTRSPGLFKTSDDVFDLHYCEKSNRHGYCHLTAEENNE
jgi:hypothetical protein